MSWFECKAKYTKETDQGLKTVSEVYLVDAVSVAEAEKRTYKAIEPFVRECDGLMVTDVSRRKYTDVMLSPNESDDKFYKVKIMFVTLDEKSGTEKKMAIFDIVQAGDLEDALNKVKESFNGSVMDYEIHTIQESQIIEVLNN